MPLSHRERVIKALSHKEPDRVPFDLGSTVDSSIHIEAYRKLKKHLNFTAEDRIIHTFMQTAAVDEPVLQKLDIDLRFAGAGGPDSRPSQPYGENGYIDEYGIVRRLSSNKLYYDVVKSPLAGEITIRDIANFKFPDPTDPGYTRGLRERVLELRKADYAIVLRLPNVFVGLSQFIRGYEDWFIDLAKDQKLAAALFDAVVDHTSAIAAQQLKAAGDLADIARASDDLGTQYGPQMPPELFRKLFKPRHKKFFDTVRKHTKAFILLHSCGSIYSLLSDIIDLGVNAIHPVQVAARDMDSAKLKKEFGDKLTFWGGIDTQRVLPRGTSDEVRAEVKKRLHDFAPGGGYILAAVHNIQPDVPVENILAMYEAGKEYGKYPIKV
jgi:uroporphyrinogen decarboxylase